MIQVENLTRYYGEFLAVDDISFEIQKGEIVGLLGPNGAGKTTTMRIMTGFLNPTKGDVKIGGYSILENPIEIKKIIGYLPENNPLYDDMGVYEYLELVANFRKLKNKSKRINSVIEQCRLGDVIDLNIGQLSRGYRQRVGFAAAILHDPEVLILDEPTSGLDPNQTHDVRQLIKEFKKEKTILISTHILSEVQMICDRAIIINKGKIVASGTTDELTSLAAGKPTISLIIKADKDNIESVLSKLETIEKIEFKGQDNGVCKFEIQSKSGYDIREDIFHLAVKKGWILLEMTQQRVSLEDVFRKLTEG